MQDQAEHDQWKRLQDQLYFGFDGTVEKPRLADSTVALYTDETASALLQNLSESWPHVEKDGELAAGTRAATNLVRTLVHRSGSQFVERTWSPSEVPTRK